MSDDKELNFADYVALFRIGPERMTMRKADAIRLAEAAQVASDELKRLRDRIAASTEFLRLIVRHELSGAQLYYCTPNAQHVQSSFNRVLTKLSTDLRKMYGVFDETEAS
jgi:hypothetical protein